ncbi:yippee zinc-binding/DNA-binding /Mis18, centromere assembly-domain-containing protein, partial [Lipomyces oligophaga]|uniref:yippee zinc-binding/DNA-binding /Mis18, centromere assembly-domain-containing protein n=1 Tax=Lipomyces oligophaga TaxID=45792 RepID=UPI0034CDD953
VVFQCASCLQIIADSSTWIRATPALRAFTLSSAPQGAVDISTSLDMSRAGPDLGSTFALFRCSTCNVQLGKVYRTTARDLDDIRDCLTFDVDAVKNYQIGSLHPAENYIPLDADLSILRPEPDAIARRLAIMETVIMAMHNDMEALKSHLAIL